MGITTRSDEEGSPIPTFRAEQVSTPKYHRVVAEPRTQTITSDALAAFADLDAFSKKLDKRKQGIEKKVVPEDVNSVPLIVNKVKSEESIQSDSMRFSDDDSLLARCAEEIELTQAVETNPPKEEVVKNVNLDDAEGFASDDSIDLIMSQLDEQEVIAEQASSPQLKQPLGNNKFRHVSRILRIRVF